MLLIDISYFTSGPRRIVNASTAQMPLQDSQVVNDAIEGYIKVYQMEFLNSIVGHRLAGYIKDYYDIIEQKEENQSADKEDNDEGTAQSPFEAICEKLREPFADYVFFHILRDINTQTTMTGLVRLKCANEYVAPIKRQVSIWNGMVKKNKEFVDWASSDKCSQNVIVDANLLTPINTFNL